MVQRAVTAVRTAYDPGGINVGLNLGKAAGAGVPGHLHVHVVPRWSVDTNFMTRWPETGCCPSPGPDLAATPGHAWPE